jgi:hypothetical protein
MSVYAVTMVRDEADIIEGTLRHMADEVDHIIVADNLSVDDTPKILDRLTGELPLTVVLDHVPAYHQAVKMTALAALAADQGATWIVPFDADELWVSHDARLREVLTDDTPGNVCAAPLYNHFATAVDPVGDDPYDTIVWRQPAPAPLPKVAVRWEHGAIIDQGNHGAHIPSGGVPVDVRLEVRHFPYRTPEQMVRKARNGAAAYRATSLPDTVGAHWRAYGDLLDRYGDEVIHDVFRTHFWHLSPTDAGLILDPAPYLRWQRSQ